MSATTRRNPPQRPVEGNLLGRDFVTAVVLFHEAVGRRLGLSAADRKTLDLITRAPLTAGELAKRTGLTTGAVTGLIDRLVKPGYAERVPDPTDRRRVIVRRLSPSRADEVLPPIFDALGKDMAELTGSYSQPELETIADFMARTRDILIEHTERLATEDR
jgi:DNA-binding MarR family transcriptional regulator